jgi:NhaP-type Na+/H+ or K+/H+ antiporter
LTTTTCDASEEGEEKHEEEYEPVDAILYPFFILALGVVSYWLLSCYAPWLPYTAVMFVLGTVIGAGATTQTRENLLNESITVWWLNIGSEVLLVAFLPGLIFSDAAAQNTHLFRVAFWQCLVFAFPMVLAGTTLTALVAYYIFPYDWSFNLAMTFGAILSATDPVAVAALLETVGAPPRLKVHIAGESLLNDGSAIVFFTIFSQRYLFGLGVDGVGEEIDGPKGVNIFFRLSCGGFCVGLFFALGLLSILSTLNRRLEKEENITQVGATVTMAYLCYFVAEVAWETSGVIAVVTLGVSRKKSKETCNDKLVVHWNGS